VKMWRQFWFSVISSPYAFAVQFKVTHFIFKEHATQ
jgi:hypothetical protein